MPGPVHVAVAAHVAVPVPVAAHVAAAVPAPAYKCSLCHNTDCTSRCLPALLGLGLALCS